MRVTIVTESFLPSANGVTTSVLRVLDHLAAHGHHAQVICPGPAPDQYAGFAVREVGSLTYRGFPIGVPSGFLTHALLDDRPDVLHAASPFLLGAQALSVARRAGIPSVAVFQTDVARFAGRYQLGAASRPAWRWLRRVHDMADVTLAPSTATLADLRRHRVPRVELWGRGVDTAGFHPRHRTTAAGTALRQRLSPNGELLVGYVGRLAPEKRVERLEALADRPGTRLVVVGDGPSRPALERQLGPRGAHFLGRLDGEQLATAYAALDVFAHTGTEETFGQTLQEAMASGVPVVAPAAGGPLDTVDHGSTGLLCSPDDDRDLRRCVDLLLDDLPRRLAMGESGRRTALTRSWDSVCDQLLGHYDTVTAAKALAAWDSSPWHPRARPQPVASLE